MLLVRSLLVGSFISFFCGVFRLLTHNIDKFHVACGKKDRMVLRRNWKWDYFPPCNNCIISIMVQDYVLELGMVMGQGGDGFCFPHPLLLYTYPLSYPYPTGMRNIISSSSSMGSGIPASPPSSQ